MVNDFRSVFYRLRYNVKFVLYGVLGAIVLRTLFIFIGAWFVQEFSWVLYIFGAFLVYTGFKFLKGQEEETNIEDIKLLKWVT